jgi:hypothetical protein
MKRNNRNRKQMLLAGALAGAIGIAAAGCSLPNSNENTSISADETGVITETVVESVGEDSFTEDELKQYIEQEIADYTDSGGGKVSLTKCTVANRTAETVMTYATCDDYAKFNNVTCFLGTIQAAEDAGYDVSQSFVDKKGAAADAEIISERAKEWKIFICEEPVQVRLPDKILYATDNVTITGRLTATVNTVLDTPVATPSAASSDSSASSAGETQTESVKASSVSSAGGSGTAAASQAAEGGTDSRQINPYATVSDYYAYIIYK